VFDLHLFELPTDLTRLQSRRGDTLFLPGFFVRLVTIVALAAVITGRLCRQRESLHASANCGLQGGRGNRYPQSAPPLTFKAGES